MHVNVEGQLCTFIALLNCCQHMTHVAGYTRDPVESVAANASTEPFVGTWVYDCWQWHLSMEPRIENSHLWHGAQQLLNGFHPFQLRAIVKRCERRGTGNSGSDLWRDQHWFLVLRTAVYNPMPHQVDVGRLGKQSFTTIPKIAKQVF